MDERQFNTFMELQKSMLEQIFQLQIKQVGEQSTSNQAPNTSVNTALLPNFENFDPKKESFRYYKQRFENYLDMKNIKCNKPYCAKLLLNSIGANNFNTVAAELGYDELIQLLEKHLSPKKNVLVAQHQFLSKYQSDKESIADYVAALRSDIGDCEFISTCECKSSIAHILLRAQFIRGIKDNTIREQLLQAETSNFNEIVSKAIALESSKIDSKELTQKLPTSNQSTEINKITNDSMKNHQGYKSKFKHKNQSLKRNKYQSQKNQRNNSTTSKINYNDLNIDGLCFRCGKDNHTSKDCRINTSNLKCAECKKTGHVAKVCIRTLINKKSKSKSSTNQVQNVTQSNEYGVSQIIDVYQNQSARDNEQFFTSVYVEGRLIKFEVDSGSAFTFLPRDQFIKFNLNTRLMPTTVRFRSYTKDVFVPDGKINVEAEYNGKAIKDEIYIVPEEYSPLLGRAWIRKLKIDLNEIDHQHSSAPVINFINESDEIEELISKFPDIFEEKIGCVQNFKVSLKLREKATPIFHREREVPYALYDRVEKELNNLEAAGIISKTETSDWGSPLVVIPKEDGGVRLCVDYKVGVNKRLTNAHYPIRKIEEIFNSLRNSRYFCRLDLYKAYLHIPVDEESSVIQTISTHRGTYKMNRLSFGIKTAPAEFNRIIDQILREVPKTESYFDDIVVHGRTKEECQSNLEACLRQLQKFDLHLNRRKCSLFQQRIDFLGHVIELNKISKSPSKIAAITNMPRPTSVEEVKRFLGMITYYSRFIPNASTITAPLRKLLQKDNNS